MNRFAGLVIHDLPVDHDARFSRPPGRRSISIACRRRQAAHRPRLACAVVVADASRVIDQLKSSIGLPVEVEGLERSQK